MNYNKKELEKVAADALTVARENLQKYGHVLPVGLIFHEGGLSHVFQFEFRNLDEKRASQAEFRNILVEVEARAAVVVTESWVKTKPETPIDVTVSLADDPERREAIVIEAVSPLASVFIMQLFSRDASGTVAFETPYQSEQNFDWFSEWLPDQRDFSTGGHRDN